MRARLTYNKTLSPYSSVSYGKTEDYTICINTPGAGNHDDTNLNKNCMENLTISYPNPFSKKANIRFYLTKGSYVKIKLYNSEGAIVKTLLGNKYNKGEHVFQFDGTELPSGLYFYLVDLENEVLTGTIIKK